jgi:hypothetical protein
VHSIITEALLPDPGFNYNEIIKTGLFSVQYMIGIFSSGYFPGV